jgi:CRP/FNR family cyclic AMP-dependent transcriptional regulator
MKSVAGLIQEHPFFSDMNPAYFEMFAGCAQLARVRAGETLARTNDPADHFFIIRKGKLSFEFASPSGTMVVQTLSDGDWAGWSWLFPPYLWPFDVKAIEDASLIVFNGKCIRDKSERDPVMGYDLMKRLSRVLAKRLHSAFLQLLDVYHPPLQSSAHMAYAPDNQSSWVRS